MSVFTGSGVAIVTPFTEDGIDFQKLGELIDMHVERRQINSAAPREKRPR